MGLWQPFLALLSILYGAGVRIRLSGYRGRHLKKESLPGFVVSIGNLTVGGTGKTPAVVMLAKWALNEGYRVAVLSRGYRGRSKERILEVFDGEVIKADPRDTGDEPYLLAQKLPGIPIIISKKRFLAGLFAHEKFGTNFFVLDDGFQHLGLRRDLDLVLIDASSPFGNGHLLPWGPLREPIDELARADATILTRFSGQASGEKTLKFINLRFPKIPAFCADHLPENIVFPFLSEVCEPDFLKGKRVLAFAGIARPDAFKETLLKLGAEVAHFRSFSDHYQFNRSEIEALIEMKDSLGARYILTSEKDWVRMASITPSCPQIAYLSIKFVLSSDQGGFYSLVRNALHSKTRSHILEFIGAKTRGQGH